ncbi:hypothetical protein BB560_005489, partial [Smittium megazygosporum]
GPKTRFYRRSRHDQSQAAKYFFEVADRISKDDLNLLRNTKKMHQMCDSRPGISSKVLSLIAGLYSSSNLKSMGFSFRAEQYILAKWMAEKERFGLNEYQRHVPDTGIGKPFRRGIRLDLSKFYKLCTKNFKKSTKQTDVCNICVSGGKVKKQSEMQGYEDVSLWSDSGPHFKNPDYFYSTRIELPWLFPRSRFTLNYFMENHGKSDVDGHFGLLTR